MTSDSPGLPLPSEARLAEKVGELEAMAQRLRELIASLPPKELLGYIYAFMLLGRTEAETDTENGDATWVPPGKDLDDAQFLLEYVHAVLATTPIAATGHLDEGVCAEVMRLANELKQRCMLAAMLIATHSANTQFGEGTKDLMFRALSAWVLLRGHRYQVLEEEFFRFALAPHDGALKRAYGAGAVEIAAGVQAIADIVRTGHAQAAQALEQSMADAHNFIEKRGLTLEDGMARWKTEASDSADAASEAIADLFQGGICNVHQHTALPSTLLDDLSYDLAEETEFFAPGPYAGTPFRTLPARKKPLVKLDGEPYLTDPSFARDAAYRAILHNLLLRDPSYAEEFKESQKRWSESAFVNVFQRQLAGAQFLNEVYYRRDGNWYENDTLVLLDGVLLLIEAKAGAAATIASPASDFDRHARAVQDLIIKAYIQCRRFLEYLTSADEVPLFALRDGSHEEVARVRLADYWLVLPIGLTIESYSPFSTGSNKLPDVRPILGKHPFLSVAVDELLVLSRFLPTAGVLMHYLRIRQEAAGIKELFLFDELDYLGAYLKQNRFSDRPREQIAKGANLVVLDGMSVIVDEYFARRDWSSTLPPFQPLPEEMHMLLQALDCTRAPGWIEADGLLRDFDEPTRNELSRNLALLRASLHQHRRRYFAFGGESGLLIWMHRAIDEPDVAAAREKASALCVATNASRILLLVVSADRSSYASAMANWMQPDGEISEAVRADAEAMIHRAIKATVPSGTGGGASSPKLGRNERCWCGSGIKFKKCHGRWSG
jgi:hypothetical protein